ncbi:hypothetical protein HETIRDRAFT_430930 [Heterobasidion irregulare TC 32-1]|uniref:rRNA-processing protein EFG1 n=1 Tax=Heterobasidion irregulare (strain TC 32-1) TaxID=747525 RepID=W4JNH3_HETIT|nr:uncharacterized protein HETIRDRAFT_430930 [Heterobasidion irregulare TC 32-1]ETW74615.1 hypothetical protein HETIRDRAFT_430930 [Heterobasidion irregulare TC 32-1]
MPPTRTQGADSAGEPSTSKEARKVRNKRYGTHHPPKESAAPGVSKLKAALRQTRRLLAKDNLAANVRVETERRLKSLEGDLAKAEVGNKERTMAMRYHKVKFFDRQKLERKIKQTKKQLDDPELSSKKKKSVESALFELRVDLNYVTNYPKTEKYISLFPPDVRTHEGAAPVHQLVSTGVTDIRREELRAHIRERMQAGQMSTEPELLERMEHAVDTGWQEAEKSGYKETEKRKSAQKVNGHRQHESRDDFFESGDEDEEMQDAQADEDVDEDADADEDEDEDQVELRSKPQVEAKAPKKAKSKGEKGRSKKKDGQKAGRKAEDSREKKLVAMKDDFFEGNGSDDE